MMTDPRKLLYLGFEITVLVAYHIPRWLISAAQIWLYEDRKGNWTFGRHIRTQVKRDMPGIWQNPPNPDHTAIQGSGGIWIPAVPRDLIIGEISTFAHNRNIASIPIPGYWIRKDEELPLESPPSPGESILYLCHGGGYSAETAHPEGVVSKILKGFLQNASSPSLRRTFAVEYRLTSPGEPGKDSISPFPAALLDALAGYLYLVKLGFPEENIIIIGDSAGANLALALTRYLLSSKEQQPNLPGVPSALVLLSPWADLSEHFNDHHDPQSSQTINAERDWLHGGRVRENAKVFLGGRPEHVELAYRNPYISPASPILLGLTPDSPTRTIHFNGFPRAFIDNGRFDTFYDQIIRLRDAMVDGLGEEMVAYNEVDGVTHDYLTIDWYDSDRTDTSKKILKWLGL